MSRRKKSQRTASSRNAQGRRLRMETLEDRRVMDAGGFADTLATDSDVLVDTDQSADIAPYTLAPSSVRHDITREAIILDPLAGGQLGYPYPANTTVTLKNVERPEWAGTFTLIEDDTKILYQPAISESGEPFLGNFVLQFQAAYGPTGAERVNSSLSVSIENTFLAVPDWFVVGPTDSGTTNGELINPLTNDRILQTNRRGGDVTLKIVAVSAGSQGGEVTIGPEGQTLSYTAVDGFLGTEVFTYTVEDSTGFQRTSEMTFAVTDKTPTEGLPTYATEGAFLQNMIDQAVRQYGELFGRTQRNGLIITPRYYSDVDFDVATGGTATNEGQSSTNTQEAGVDEADLNETDGRYAYTFSDGKLVIVDVQDPNNPQAISFTPFDDRMDRMMLSGDRLILLGRSSESYATSVITILDVSDRAAPQVLQHTEVDAQIVTSRMIGEQLHVVYSNPLQTPAIDLVPETALALARAPSLAQEQLNLHGFSTYGGTANRAYETLESYLDRVREPYLDSSLGVVRSYNGDGQVLIEGRLNSAANVHQPHGRISQDATVTTLATFDLSQIINAHPYTTAVVTNASTQAYFSPTAAYLLSTDSVQTKIHKFDLTAPLTHPLVATGSVDGAILNQFSVDEHDGQIRIATTEQWTYGAQRTPTPGNEWHVSLRWTTRTNNVYVLEQSGTDLNIIGHVDDIAPTEDIRSVRFLGDRAFVVTFRQVDPLFAIDLADPTNPTIAGELKLPGFSSYLHPIGEDYLIGVGYDATPTGRRTHPQVSLFYVGDLDTPTLLDQHTFTDLVWGSSEVANDHHAFNYFASESIFTLPVYGNKIVDAPTNGGSRYQEDSALWAFSVDTALGEDATLEVAGRITHDTLPNRASRVGRALLTFSNNTLQVNDFRDLDQQLASLYLGKLPVDDQYNIDEDSGTHTLAVLENDRLGTGGTTPLITSVTQPSDSSQSTPTPFYQTLSLRAAGYPYNGNTDGGTVTISEDGSSVRFTPHEDFFGTTSFTYTVTDPLRGEQTAHVTVTVNEQDDTPEAVDDEFAVEQDAQSVTLNVLANDVNVDYRNPTYSTSWYGYQYTDVYYPGPDLYQGMWVDSVGETTNGGTVKSSSRTVTYTPAPGFTGIDTFTYTVKNHAGVSTNQATVSLYVGMPLPAEPTTPFVQPSTTTRGEFPIYPRNPGERGTSPATRRFVGPIQNYWIEDATGQEETPAGTVAPLSSAEAPATREVAPVVWGPLAAESDNFAAATIDLAHSDREATLRQLFDDQLLDQLVEDRA